MYSTTIYNILIQMLSSPRKSTCTAQQKREMGFKICNTISEQGKLTIFISIVYDLLVRVVTDHTERICCCSRVDDLCSRLTLTRANETEWFTRGTTRSQELYDECQSSSSRMSMKLWRKFFKEGSARGIDVSGRWVYEHTRPRECYHHWRRRSVTTRWLSHYSSDQKQ